MEREAYEKGLAALEKSLEKWNNIVLGEEADNGHKNCECCKQYTDCDDCPIGMRSGDGCTCADTPYEDWTHHQVHDHDTYKPWKVKSGCSQCLTFATAMRNYIADTITWWREYHKGEVK